MKTNTRCRICKNSDLSLFLDLGKTALANSFLKKEMLGKPEPKYPLRVFFCRSCNLVQLINVIEPEILFRNYVYFSSGMPILPEHFRNYAEEVAHDFIVSKNSLVIEIGSNDGLLLGTIKNLGTRVLGIDPAENIAKIANEKGVKTLSEFFSAKLAKKIAKKYGKASVVIGNNVVAHINDHHDLIRGVKAVLATDGVFIFEAPYLMDMFENFTFDTIYHEHLSYLSLKPLIQLFKEFSMDIFDIKIFPVQGHSIRVYASRAGGREIKPAVSELLKKEKNAGLDKFLIYAQLAKNIENMKEKTVRLLKGLKNQGKKIAAYGAPAKGNTLLSYYDLGADVIDYATEELPSKVGLYTPGTHIPVIHIKEARENPPDYFLLLAWNYRDAILEKERSLRAKGVKFIMPVGNCEII